MRSVLSLLTAPFGQERFPLGRKAVTSNPDRRPLAVAMAPVPLAQEADEAEEADETTQVVDQDTEVVIVTGSRLKRSTYTSVAPLQIITAEVAREAGLVDAGDIISGVAGLGWAADRPDLPRLRPGRRSWFGDGKPARTGLSADPSDDQRSTGRPRPAWRGAPSSPSLDVIPGMLVQTYDQLLDGASSVYGSDAVAGVVNAILRKDFDGLEVEVFPRYSEHGAGRENILSGRWGRNFDRGFIGVGAQYSDVEAVTLADRPWTAGCAQHWEVDQGGNIRNKDLWYPHEVNYGMEMDECIATGFACSGASSFPARA